MEYLNTLGPSRQFLYNNCQVYLTDILLSLPCCMASTTLICIDQLVVSCSYSKDFAAAAAFASFDFFFNSCSGHLSKGRFCLSSWESQSVCQNLRERGNRGVQDFEAAKQGFSLVSSSLWQPVTSAGFLHVCPQAAGTAGGVCPRCAGAPPPRGALLLGLGGGRSHDYPE